MIAEYWPANILCFHYTVSEALIPMLDKAIEDLADETAWYNRFTGSEKYADIPLPPFYMDRNEWLALITPFLGTDTDDISALIPNIETYEDLAE